MAKSVIGSYPSEAAALQKVDQLLSEGSLKESITLVTNATIGQSIRNQTDIDVFIQPSKPATDNSLGDKIKAVFSSGSDDDTKLYSLKHREDSFADYKEAIEQGEIVVLLDNEASIAGSSVTPYPIDTDIMKEDATGIYPTDVYLEDDPSDLARGERQPRSIRNQHLEFDYDETDLDPGIITDGDLEIEDDFPPTESPDRSDFY
ncbi:general stress protein [Carnobacterium sp. 17-4]|uniref:general stress protein n=1 Tax=Carnobacterium sp. (strain 17-4) TaxID=208596 RepID=UPI0002EB2CD2|nr:general stress protein [Carnobacterium sp. 17-4]